jgi:hypothetical protein
VLAQFREIPSPTNDPSEALTWLRAQCIAALRAEVERTGHLMVTREQLERLCVAAHEHEASDHIDEEIEYVCARKEVGLD